MPHTQFDSEPSAGSKNLAPLQYNVSSRRLTPVYNYNLRDTAINKIRRVRGKTDETLNPAGVVDVFAPLFCSLFFFVFPHPERSKDSGCFHKCSKAFVSAL